MLYNVGRLRASRVDIAKNASLIVALWQKVTINENTFLVNLKKLKMYIKKNMNPI